MKTPLNSFKNFVIIKYIDISYCYGANYIHISEDFFHSKLMQDNFVIIKYNVHKVK